MTATQPPMRTETAATLPVAWAALHAALVERHAVHVSYHGRLRLICPHALGWKNQKAMVLGYQIGGQTTTGTLDPDPRKRWRCLYLDQIDHLVTDRTAIWQTADNYNPNRPFNSIDHLAAALPNEIATPLSMSVESP